MDVPIDEAAARLGELVRLAELGEDVVVTHEGSAVRLMPVRSAPLQGEALRRRLKEISAAGARAATPGPSAARSQDFLYDEDGLPG